MTTWWEYVQDVSDGVGPEKVAEKTGIPGPTISRWNPAAKGGAARPSPDKVVQFARAYERSPFEALLRADYGINPEDLDIPMQAPVPMDNVTDEALVRELSRRLTALRRTQLTGNDRKDWSRFRRPGENPGVGRVKNGD
jgi:transcriptional regulator with XRE-family HTH domain